jgi:hypothetical protein
MAQAAQIVLRISIDVPVKPLRLKTAAAFFRRKSRECRSFQHHWRLLAAALALSLLWTPAAGRA